MSRRERRQKGSSGDGLQTIASGDDALYEGSLTDLGMVVGSEDDEGSEEGQSSSMRRGGLLRRISTGLKDGLSSSKKSRRRHTSALAVLQPPEPPQASVLVTEAAITSTPTPRTPPSSEEEEELLEDSFDEPHGLMSRAIPATRGSPFGARSAALPAGLSRALTLSDLVEPSAYQYGSPLGATSREPAATPLTDPMPRRARTNRGGALGSRVGKAGAGAGGGVGVGAAGASPPPPPPNIFEVAWEGSQPFASDAEARINMRPLMSTDAVSYDRLLQAAFSGDTLSCLCNLVGLRRLHVFGQVCTTWHDAIQAKMREWGVLTYVRAIGRGFGKLPGYFDMPTWICMLPDGMWGSNLCVVDACNYRLQIIAPLDGALVRTVGRPGAGLGELSSPSSIAHDPKRGGRPVVFASSNVGPNDRRILAFDLDTWRLVDSTPEGSGKSQVDAPEGMVCVGHRLFVVDTANHRVVAFDALTLAKVGQYPPVSWVRVGEDQKNYQLHCPQDIAAYEGELFVSDTHNDRIQIFTSALEWIGTIGQRGRAAGQFIYPRGVTVARSGSAPPLLYVCEQTRIQALTLLGEPRIIVPVPGAINLCGICSDGLRVYCTDMDGHCVHVLRLSHSEGWREKRREAMAEAKARDALRAGGSGEAGGEAQQRAEARRLERSEKERRRDRAVSSVLGNRAVHAMLGLPASATVGELEQGVRLAMRLLHPDLAINLALKGRAEYLRIEAAFKKVARAPKHTRPPPHAPPSRRWHACPSIHAPHPTPASRRCLLPSLPAPSPSTLSPPLSHPTLLMLSSVGALPPPPATRSGQ